MESKPDVPPESAPAATAASSGGRVRSDTTPVDAAGADGTESTLDAASPEPPLAPLTPATPVTPELMPGMLARRDDQATVLDLRREQLANGSDGAHGPHAPAGGQPPDAAEPFAHDAATYQDAPAGAAPAWHIPASPPYAPPPSPRPLPRGTLPSPRAYAPWRVAQSWGPTSFTISADTAAGFSYLLWWLSGLIVYFAERNNRYVRFHALQSILLTSAFTVLGVVAFVLDALLHDLTRATHWTVFATLGSGVAVLVVILGIVIPWLGTMIGAWTGHHIRWPIVGAYAERYAAPPLHIPGSPF